MGTNKSPIRSKIPLTEVKAVAAVQSKSPLKPLKAQPKSTCNSTKSSRKQAGSPLSVHDRRKRVLEEQRRIKINKQVSMGILPLPQDDTSLSKVLQKHKRSASPSPEKKRKDPALKRPRSASPSVAMETGVRKMPIPIVTTEKGNKEGVPGKKHREVFEQVSQDIIRISY